jgi:hypothetical protein
MSLFLNLRNRPKVVCLNSHFALKKRKFKCISNFVQHSKFYFINFTWKIMVRFQFMQNVFQFLFYVRNFKPTFCRIIILSIFNWTMYMLNAYAVLVTHIFLHSEVFLHWINVSKIHIQTFVSIFSTTLHCNARIRSYGRKCRFSQVQIKVQAIYQLACGSFLWWSVNFIEQGSNAISFLCYKMISTYFLIHILKFKNQI